MSARTSEYTPSFEEFCKHDNFLGEEISHPWVVFYKAVEGEPLARSDKKLFREMTGQLQYRPRVYEEATAICGRRSEKSTTAIKYMLWKAVYGGLHKLAAKGDTLRMPVIAQDMRIAGENLTKASQLMLQSPFLKSQVADEPTKTELRLVNGIIISIYPCTFRSTRGLTAPLFVCDEVSYWPKEGASDEEVMSAIYPGTIQFGPQRRILKLATPWMKSGVIYKDFMGRADNEYKMVWNAPTSVMNPRIPKVYLEREFKEKGALYFRREYEAQFVDNLESWIDPEDIETALTLGSGKKVLPPEEGSSYVAALDASSLRNRDRFALGIGRVDDNEILSPALFKSWTKEGVPQVCDELAGHCKSYQVKLVLCDQYAFPFVQELLRQRGVRAELYTFGPHSKQSLYTNMKRMFAEQRIRMLNHEDALREIRSLEARKLSSGGYAISAPRGERDDYASVLALLAHQVKRRAEVWVAYASANAHREEMVN